ncbi:flagellar assembly peptidoglycan hydrolase FlgJ [Pusillimonas sp.]|uniref:flagellar assembly peptidoglycan hydrolase FlgJ n=1 Tax=Pusillimonas sp. TaxID=3040095 RepID=UPI0039C8DE8B
MSFVRYIPRPTESSRNALDTGALSRLQGGVARSGGSADEQKEVARQFEALFLQQMIKQARQASSGLQGLFQSDQTRLAQSLADEQMALQLAEPGVGLAQALLDQMRGGVQGDRQINITAGNTPPELSSSRNPALRSSVGPERPEHAPSISALIDMLSNSKVGRVAGAAVSAIRGAPQHIEQFVIKMGNAARHASAESGVPSELILSQAALESGWGRREIRGEDGSQSYNLFGIKASPNWKGKVVNIVTTEYIDGEPRKMVQPFRAYDSYAESFADYARLISQNERYSEVVKAQSPQEAARSIQQAGYATDPAYAEKLISIMSYFDSRRV